MRSPIQILMIVAIACLCVLSACKTASAPDLPPDQMQAFPAKTVSSGSRDSHENLNSVLWMQTAVEHQIIYQLIFDSARNALDQALQDPNWTAALEQNSSSQSLPPAIILDVDETVLDNSLFYGRLVKDHTRYDFNLWEDWVAQSKAPPTPGAADFVFYAASKGVEIFYVTNRDANMEKATRLNLSRLGGNISISVDTVLMNGEKPEWTSDKSSRRAYIAQNYRILLLMGDDLGDFISGAKDTLENRERLAAKYHSQWGRRWFLFPNPVYGSWESALYGYDIAMSDVEVLGKKFETVKYFGGSAAQTTQQKTPVVVPDMTITFSGDTCLYDGPEKVYSGKLTVSLIAKEKKHPYYELFIATFEPGKTMQDLINWQSLDQPPWVNAVDSKTVSPGSPTFMSPIVTGGPLYLICFGASPDMIVGRWGPIAVEK